MFELREALGWLTQARLQGQGDIRVSSVCTDTRELVPGCLFVALRGENFDANELLDKAEQAGAAAVVCERGEQALGIPALVVPDSRRALGELARGWRLRFELPVIAVTGSNGKTTVKEMVSSILAAHFGEVARLATAGNLNNEVGVPQTLFRLAASHRAAVLELGMNHPGEIAWLAEISRPTVALVNNAQREHQEFLKTVEATARENGAAISALSADGVAVFPAADAHVGVWRELAAGRRSLEFGLGDGPSVSAPLQASPAAFEISIEGHKHQVTLAIDGRHNVLNALAAASCAHAIGIDADTIVRGLEQFRPYRGRLVRMRCQSGAVLIDDSYNANPDSVRAAIDVLAQFEGPRVLVLGDMGEVGEQGPRYHREVGAYAAACGVAHLLTLGAATRDATQAFGVGAMHFGDDLDALLKRVHELAQPNACVLVKGSMFMKMGRVVSALAGDPVAGGGH